MSSTSRGALLEHGVAVLADGSARPRPHPTGGPGRPEPRASDGGRVDLHAQTPAARAGAPRRQEVAQRAVRRRPRPGSGPSPSGATVTRPARCRRRPAWLAQRLGVARGQGRPTRGPGRRTAAAPTVAAHRRLLVEHGPGLAPRRPPSRTGWSGHPRLDLHAGRRPRRCRGRPPGGRPAPGGPSVVLGGREPRRQQVQVDVEEGHRRRRGAPGAAPPRCPRAPASSGSSPARPAASGRPPRPPRPRAARPAPRAGRLTPARSVFMRNRAARRHTHRSGARRSAGTRSTVLVLGPRSAAPQRVAAGQLAAVAAGQQAGAARCGCRRTPAAHAPRPGSSRTARARRTNSSENSPGARVRPAAVDALERRPARPAPRAGRGEQSGTARAHQRAPAAAPAR